MAYFVRDPVEEWQTVGLHGAGPRARSMNFAVIEERQDKTAASSWLVDIHRE